MIADNDRDDRRPGDEPGQGARLPKVGPRVAPVRKPEPRELREIRWLVASIRERGLAA